MPSKTNLLISAVAGCGKTTRIVRDGCNCDSKRILFTTYTINNTEAIREKIEEITGTIPKNITVQTWFSFLLENWVRPYANTFPGVNCVEGMSFSEGRSAKYIPKNIPEHYLADNNTIYSDKLSMFGLECNKKNGGLNISRLEEVYDQIIIDEVQDLSGYDLDLLSLLIHSKISIMMVGDPHQRIFETNESPYKKRESENIIRWLKSEYKSSIEYEEMSNSFRCSKAICEFVNKLYPEMNMVSNNEKSDLDGIFYIRGMDELKQHLEGKNVTVLGHNISSKPSLADISYMNMGASKGLSFDHVVIVVTEPIRNYLEKGTPIDKELSKRKFYVAITRARYSVAFYYPDKSKKKK
ncbi:MAG: UvrD-helicase domain-containing protein [Candidatus Methanomethylophilaceae archaeon]|nr:UvrD-helicase domain-containing protein [Candidatus Methanomethylophilaceae archaeon]